MKTTTVVYGRRQKFRDNHENIYGNTTNDHDSVTVALPFKPRQQATTSTTEILNSFTFVAFLEPRAKAELLP